MRRILLAGFVLLALPLVVSAETWKDMQLMDSACAAKAQRGPEADSRTCMLQCAKTGFGVITSDGKFLKFDPEGNRKTEQLLKSTDRKDHIRVNVTGEQQGDTIRVEKISM